MTRRNSSPSFSAARRQKISGAAEGHDPDGAVGLGRGLGAGAETGQQHEGEKQADELFHFLNAFPERFRHKLRKFISPFPGDGHILSHAAGFAIGFGALRGGSGVRFCPDLMSDTRTRRDHGAYMEKCARAFAYVATCGTELADVDYEGDEELRRALLAVCVDAMNAAMRKLTGELTARYRLGNTAVLNPGSLPEWPLADQDKIFAMLGDLTGDVGVTLGANHFMTPLASGSGLLFETEQDYQNCTYCTNLKCVIRRAPYDPEKAAELRPYSAESVAAP